MFVSNVLNGTVTRIDLKVPTNGSSPTVLSETRIASGYAHHTDPAALLVGPTGLAFDAKTDTLFVASTVVVGRDVRSVIVDGKLVMKEREILTVDMDALRERLKRRAPEIMARFEALVA